VHSLELWMVRHARPLVAAGTCYGRLDVAADPEHTQASAQALSSALRAAGPVMTPEPWLVWSSPLARALSLAQALVNCAPAAVALHPCKVDQRLAEMDFGTWEGQRWQDIPRGALEAWTDDFHHHRPGGGDNVAGFLTRVRDALDDCAREVHARRARGAIWFTHAGVIRAVEVWLAGLPQPLQARDWPQKTCDFGEWNIQVLKTSPSGLIIGTR